MAVRYKFACIFIQDKVNGVVSKNLDKIIKKGLDLVMTAIEGAIDMAIEKINEMTNGESLRVSLHQNYHYIVILDRKILNNAFWDLGFFC